jgi:hypothetical protein
MAMPFRSVSVLAAFALVGLALAAAPAPAADADASATTEDSWARCLFDFVPAIDACLAAAPEPASILEAWPMNRGMVGMRLVDVLGAYWTCVGEASGASVEIFEPAEAPLEPAVEPVFTRAPGAPPPGGCYEHEEVEDAAGEVIGWLSFNIC